MDKLVRCLPILIACSAAAQPVVWDAESLEGCRQTWGGNALEEAKLSVNTDPRFVSQGRASIRLSAHARAVEGSKYLGVMADIEPLNLQGKGLLVDLWTTTPNETRAVYLRLYDAEGRRVGSWSNWSAPFSASSHITMAFGRLASSHRSLFETNNVADAPWTSLRRLELIIGTRDDDVDFDVFVDNVRIDPQPQKSVFGIDRPAPLVRETALVTGGKPSAIIVHPADANHRAAARRLRDELRKKTGAELPLMAADGDAAVKAARDSHVIALGRFDNNRVIERLYANYFCAVDAMFPGEGGWVVRTVHDPWGSGKNVVLLGGADADAVGRACQQVLSLVKPGASVALPPIARVHASDEVQSRLPALTRKLPEDYVQRQVAAVRRNLQAGIHTGAFSSIARAADNYLLTGHALYAREFVALVDLAQEFHDSSPGTYGGPWGMDSDFRAYRVLPGWDVVEECAALTDADRLRVTHTLMQWVREAVAPKAAGTVSNWRVRFNHQTFPGLGCYAAGDYLRRHYPECVEGREWLHIARACFAVQAKSWKPYEDCNGYQWLSLGHMIRYASAAGDFSYMDSGSAKQSADFALAGMDNLGYQAPYGDTGSWRCWFSELALLRPAAWYYGVRTGRDKEAAEEYRWAVALKERISGRKWTLNDFHTSLPERVPQRLAGLQVFPVDANYYRTWSGANYLPLERTFDKVSMRSSFDPADEYLLLDGLSNGGHKHYDGNTIIRITDKGRIWLADNDYYKAAPKFHNGVLTIADGQSASPPPFVALAAKADLPDLGYTDTVSGDYADANWHRRLLWRKGSDFLVLDQVMAKRDTDYDARVLWYGVGEVRSLAGGMELEQQGPRFYILGDDQVVTQLTDDRALGKNWLGYPFADPVVRRLQQRVRRDLRKGESLTVLHLLRAAEGDEHAPEVRRVRQGLWRVHAGGHAALVWLRLSDGARPPVSALDTDAQLLYLDDERLVALEATSLALGGVTMRSDGPAGVEVRRDGRVFSDGPGQVRWTEGKSSFPQLSRASVWSAAERLDLPPRTSPSPVVAVPEGLPAMELAWTYRRPPADLLLSSNAGSSAAVDVGADIRVEPKPSAANCFSGKPQRLESLTDGDRQSTDGCLQWEDNQTVRVDIDLGAPRQVTRVIIDAWWASSSSKGRKFQLASLRAEVSDDGFQSDKRLVAELLDDKQHGNWGAPGHAPERYRLDIKQRARHLRLTLTPRAGTAVYIAELEVWGWDASLRQAAARGTLKVGPRLSALTAVGDDLLLGDEDGYVTRLNSAGKERWRFHAGGAIHALVAADVDGDGDSEIAAGAADAGVYCLNGDGALRWKRELPRYKAVAQVRVLMAADLDGKPGEEIIAGADNWRYHALSGRGEVLWHFESVHQSTAGAVGDLDGDGSPEVVCGTQYYWWPCVDAEGKRRWSYATRTGPGANCVAIADVTGDSKREVAIGGADSNVHLVDADGKLLWLYNCGDEVTGVVPQAAGGAEELVVASLSGNVYCLNGKAERRWRRPVSDGVRRLIAIGDGRLAAVCVDGSVWGLEADGEVVSVTQRNATPLVATRWQDGVAVAWSDGAVTAYRQS